MKKKINILMGLSIGIFLIINHQLLVIPTDSEVNIKYNLQFYIDIISKISFLIYCVFIMYKTENNKFSKLKISYILLLDIFLLISNSFIKSGSLIYIYGNIKNIFYTIFFLIANYILIKRSLIFIENFIKKREFKFKKNKLSILIEKYPFTLSFIVLFTVFLIYMIIYYPIILSPDPSFQIKQFFNVKTKYADYSILLDNTVFLTNHHPVIHTLLLGGCLKLGRMFINDNFGLFIYSFIQSIFLISTLAYTIKYLRDNNCNGKVLLLLLTIYSIVPMYGFYSMSGVKDTIYTCFIIWYVLFIDKIIRTKKLSTKEMLILIIILIGTVLFRNNGIYVIVLSLPFLIIYSKDLRKKLIAVFLIVITFYGVFDKVILPYYKITPGSIRETLSIPFQQTARYVKYYEEDLSTSDKKKIDKVLGYDGLKERYNPMIADPVKNKFNKYTSTEDLKNYFIVWFKCFFKHPLVYMEATLNNIYGYFSPQQTNWYIYYKYDTRITQNNLVDYHYNNLNKVRNILTSYGQAYPYIPLVGLISNIGFNTWILLALAMYSILKKKRYFLIVLSPLLISLIICIASPVNTYFRYAMPYIFILPCLTILFVKRYKEN